jgi:NAD(P)-dependent dehydrogenase (short-subunit alcohol dehydrogenase family)
VLVSSDAGRVGGLGDTPYAAAKAGIVGFTKSLARSLVRLRITVTVCAPARGIRRYSIPIPNRCVRLCCVQSRSAAAPSLKISPVPCSVRRGVMKLVSIVAEIVAGGGTPGRSSQR